jgi:hypothetical protein
MLAIGLFVSIADIDVTALEQAALMAAAPPA